MSFSPDSIIAVIGAGAMGSGIAQVAAQAGHIVIIVDANLVALERGRSGINRSLEKLVKRGAINTESQDAIMSRLSWTSDLAKVASASLVIEAIIEDFEIKIALLDKLAASVSSDATLASNTSSLSINDMAAHITNPERFVGLHFFNPVPAMKLVEVVPGEQTGEDVTAALFCLMKSWGKVAVRVRDVPGFIVNRVARPYYAEGFAALGEGIEAASIDYALTGAGGFRMGPLALADMIGHDVNYVVARSVYDAYEGKTRFRPQPSQQALLDSGKLGRKSGSGVYDYSVDIQESVVVVSDNAPAEIEIAGQHDGIKAVLDLARQADIDVVTNAALPADSLKVAGIVITLGDGRSLASREDIDVLLDHARDYASASTWVLTARNDRASHIAAGLAQALGKRTIFMPDRPGQIVLRTLAQLANAATDAVADSVASAEDIDAAMRFGANHPEGPIEWAVRYGHERLAAALTNIAEATGDDMYHPSPLFACEKAPVA